MLFLQLKFCCPNVNSVNGGLEEGFHAQLAAGSTEPDVLFSLEPTARSTAAWVTNAGRVKPISTQSSNFSHTTANSTAVKRQKMVHRMPKSNVR